VKESIPSDTSSKCAEWQSMLGGEAAAGISFSNTLAGISTAVLGILVAVPPAYGSELLILTAVTALVSSFYSTICYANTFGAMRLKKCQSDCLNPIIWGNALSEYLGLFLMNAIIIVGVFGYTGDPTQSRIAYAIALIWFAVYHITGFDLLSRIVPRLFPRLLIIFVFVGLIIAVVEFLIAGLLTYAWGLTLAYLSSCMILMAIDIWKLQNREK